MSFSSACFLRSHRAVRALVAMALAALLAGCTPDRATPAAVMPLPTSAPEHLADTGLYADFALRTPAPGVLTFAPQYPLWTDGAAKRRWISLPPGEAIDATDIDNWQFPIGTRLWKEFAFERAVETRFMLHLARFQMRAAPQRVGCSDRRAPVARRACPTLRFHRGPSRGSCRP